MASDIFLSCLFFILLSSLSSASNGGIKDKHSVLSQPQASVSVTIGEVLHLECEVCNNLILGPVKWFLGKGSQRKLIYADAETDERDERITRNSPGSNTDFTIFIRNVTLEDAGTYYCVKEKKGLWESTVWLEGRGTQVAVEASRNNGSIVALAVGISGCILVCLFCGAVCVYLKKKKGLRNNHARSDAIFLEKQQPDSKPTSGDKEVVYADLKDPSELQIPRKINSEEPSEYATIKGAPTAASDKGTFYSLNL